ncbi:hemerythrin domain-containing protein [Sedimenticola hydrogenitrophicus]|uniref:hemerythrin domain-containing protein n=1 Tax=Sedimenticola hydrogenitrophicus TaxID=2967975 RepID=UPI0023AED2FA|nr:hemerythrin domain-containing protein [Sedimenticola hydrogenitrophicus]
MTTITETMARNHRHCDELFAEAEELISQGDWVQGRDKFEAFRDTTENHFTMEEGVLFPGFEQRTGQTMGPTQMMRMEHAQMRQLMADMEAAVAHEDDERYLGLSETMMMVMQQHNMKEEQMLYPMTDQAFAGDAEATLQEMKML